MDWQIDHNHRQRFFPEIQIQALVIYLVAKDVTHE
jgi:hypothetical protein